MKRNLFEARFYETYYFANIVHNILLDQFNYLRLLDEYYGELKYLNYVKPFMKYSAFHSFIGFIVNSVIYDEIEDIKLDCRQDDMERIKSIPYSLDQIKPTIFPINEALEHYNLKYISFEKWLKERKKDFMSSDDNDVSDYYYELFEDATYEQLIERIVKEVFFMLFQNRNTLLLYNDMMATQITKTNLKEIEDEYIAYFSAKGKLKRVTIPEWVKRAVFFRDRGLCVICHNDLSGILNISNIDNFDHIVPLAKGGLNDVSNIQLLCQECNCKKSGNRIVSSDIYEEWYPMNE